MKKRDMIRSKKPIRDVTRCPACGGKTGVKECRNYGTGFRRTRICRACGKQAQTIEMDMDYFNVLIETEDTLERFLKIAKEQEGKDAENG